MVSELVGTEPETVTHLSRLEGRDAQSWLSKPSRELGTIAADRSMMRRAGSPDLSQWALERPGGLWTNIERKRHSSPLVEQDWKGGASRRPPHLAGLTSCTLAVYILPVHSVTDSLSELKAHPASLGNEESRVRAFKFRGTCLSTLPADDAAGAEVLVRAEDAEPPGSIVALTEVCDKEILELTRLATTYALAHGLLYLPVGDVQPPAPASAIHAPLALFPTSYPRSKFLLAQKLQPLYNILYARVATDEKFLDEVMGGVDGVGKVDRFTGQLWECWKQLRDEGIQQSCHLGLFRSDYLLHYPDGDKEVSLKQVEFNTISSSFGTLSYRAAALHRYLAKSTSYFGAFPGLNLDDLPPNDTPAGLARGLAEAHATYGSTNAQILFVVQANERNVFDQTHLEYELLERHTLHVIRQTLDELAKSAEVDPSTRVLRIKHPVTNQTVEISTVYFRAGYTPTDYPTQAQFATRLLLERSCAIKCPTIQLQLAGGKKVQQVLAKPGVLESFLFDRTRWDGPDFTEADVKLLRDSWMGMWGLDDDGDGGVNKARSAAEKLVLKPQREGGGNNVYKSSIPGFLDTLPLAEREAWIAMELIETPKGVNNYLVRAGSGSQGAVATETISELGIFGWALFGPSARAVKHEEAGWLVRTKGRNSDEGGIATGFSVLDSLLLVDE